jgi:hypothetical protein
VHPGHDAADLVRDGVERRHRRCVHEFVGHLLERGARRGRRSLHCHRRRPGRVDGLEGIFHLVEPSLGAEDGDVVVETGRGAAGHGEAGEERLGTGERELRSRLEMMTCRTNE